MPRRYGRKYSSRPSYSRGRRSAAASKISRAWRIRRRRKTSLVSRTVLSNRRQIRKIKSNVETKVCQAGIASQANQFQAGLSCGGVTVDNNGNWIDYSTPPPYTQGTFACDMLNLAQGVEGDSRVGDWVTMKSLTIKYALTADRKSYNSTYGLLLVVDNQPAQGGASLADVLQKTGPGALAQQSNSMGMSFQNLSTTGKGGRFKILWHKKHKLSCLANAHTGAQVPAIVTQPAAGAGNTTYGNTNRAAYTSTVLTSSSKGYQTSLMGSKTLKIPFKLNYGTAATSTQCENRTILFMAYQYSDLGQAVPQALLQWRARFRFKDA